jgi:hypothetical protein
MEKGKKSRANSEKDTPLPLKKNRFPFAIRSRRMGWESPSPTYLSQIITFAITLKICYMKKYANMTGLEMRAGRLINNAPDGMTGIQQAANARKMMKREEKMSMMTEAMYRAEMRADMSEMMAMPIKMRK